MSAYLCDPAHLAVLAVRLFPNDPTKAERAARILLKENVRSVHYRYAHHADCTTPEKTCHAFLTLTYNEYVDRTVSLTQDPQLHAQALALHPGRIVGLAQCLDYQSCEHEEWRTSAAKRLLEKLITRQGDVVSDGWSLKPDELLYTVA